MSGHGPEGGGDPGAAAAVHEHGNTPFTPEDAQQVQEALEAQRVASEQPTEVLSAAKPLADGEANLKLHIASLDDTIRQRAIDSAERKLQTEATEGSFLKRAVRNVWKGTYAHEYYREKYAQEFQQQMREDGGNQFAPEGGDKAAHDRAAAALIDRLIASQESDDVQLAKGEKVAPMAESGAEIALQSGMREIIGRYAKGEFDVEQLREERTRLMDQLREEHPGLLNGAHVMADNLVGVAEQAKAMVEHGRDLESLVAGIEFYADEARAGVRTEMQRTAVDRIVERLQGSKFGACVNETTLATSVSIAVSAAKIASLRTAGSALSAVAPGIFAGGFAGLRENTRYKQERTQHMRETAEGRKAEPGSKRRERMGDAVYSHRSAEDLSADLELTGEGLTQERAAALLSTLAEIRARQETSDTQKVDLISFSSVEKVDSERLQLTLRQAGAMARLRQYTDGLPPEQKNRLFRGGTLDEYLREQTEARKICISEEMKDVDKTFRAMKRQAVAGAITKGVLTGLTFGILGQEAFAAVSNQHQGELESLFGHKDTAEGQSAVHQTFLRGLFHDTPRPYETGGRGLGKAFFERVDGHNTVKLPHGFRLHHHPGTGMTLDEGTHTLARNLHMHGNGFTPGTEQRLSQLGITHDSHLAPVERTRHIIASTKASEYFRAHHEGTVHVERTLWYDNDTPAPVFDKNELRLQWGGEHDAGVTKGGDYAFNIAQMTPDGSYHTPDSANAQQLIREGKIRILLSANEQTQSRPFSFTIDKNGNAHIPKDSVAGRSLFAERNGQAVFEGRYAEVAQVVSNNGGREQVRLLATQEGPGVNTIRHSVTEHLVAHHRVTELNIPRTETVTDSLPVIPLSFRRELEPVEASPQAVRIYYAYNRPMSEAEARRAAERRSPRLLADPDAELDPNQEVRDYLDRQPRAERRFAQELASQVSEPMSADCKMVIAIPVAGHQEGDNIYRTLESYTHQTADPSEYEIILFVNKPERDESGNPIEADKTQSEIDRFIENHPEMPVRVMSAVLPGAPQMSTIRKGLTDAILLRDQQRPSRPGDLIIASNDADAVGVAREYVQTMTRKFSESPNVDAMLGQVDWDPEAYANNPLLHIGTRFFTLVEASERRSRNILGSSGANFVFRASIYAAIGGYDRVEGAGEDVVFGRAIKEARSGAAVHVPIAFAGTQKSRIYTSARRALKSLEDGLSPYEQWNGVFGAFDDDVRRLDTGSVRERVDFDDDAEVVAFTAQVESMLNRTIGQMVEGGSIPVSAGPDGAHDSSIDRALRFMGINYEWVDSDRIKILDINAMRVGLMGYQVDHEEILRSRTN